jgi:hypothetical protein
MAFRFWQAMGGLMGYLARLLRQVERHALSERRMSISLKDLHTAHMDSIWVAQRIPNLPQPVKEQVTAPTTADLVSELTGLVLSFRFRSFIGHAGPQRRTSSP